MSRPVVTTRRTVWILVAAACLGGVTLAVVVLPNRLAITRAEAQALGERAEINALFVASGDVCARRPCPPPALIASGAALVAEAERRGEHANSPAWATAEHRLRTALAAVPQDPSALTWLAYVRATRGGAAAEVLDLYGRSYAVSPYLAREGFWRVRFGALVWPNLSPVLRERVIAEAAWLAQIDPDGLPPQLDPRTNPGVELLIRTRVAEIPAPELPPHRRSRRPGDVGPFQD